MQLFSSFRCNFIGKRDKLSPLCFRLRAYPENLTADVIASPNGAKPSPLGRGDCFGGCGYYV